MLCLSNVQTHLTVAGSGGVKVVEDPTPSTCWRVKISVIIATHDRRGAPDYPTYIETWSLSVATNPGAHAHMADPCPLKHGSPFKNCADCSEEAVQAAAAGKGTKQSAEAAVLTTAILLLLGLRVVALLRRRVATLLRSALVVAALLLRRVAALLRRIVATLARGRRRAVAHVALVLVAALGRAAAVRALVLVVGGRRVGRGLIVV